VLWLVRADSGDLAVLPMPREESVGSFTCMTISFMLISDSFCPQ
jgi:hypothetical protein